MAKKPQMPAKMPEACPDPWRAEEDARTLSRAAEVTNDKGRHKAAQDHATKTYNATMSMGAKPKKPSAPKPMKPKAPRGAKRGR